MFDVGDPWQSYKNLDRLVYRQAKALRDREAVLKRAERFYQQGRDEEAKHLIIGYIGRINKA